MQSKPSTDRIDLAGSHLALFWSLQTDIDPFFRLLASEKPRGITLFVEGENDACRAELIAHACDVNDLVLFHLDPRWRMSAGLIGQILRTQPPDLVIACQNAASSLNTLQARLQQARYFASDRVLTHNEFAATFLADRDLSLDDLMPTKGRFSLGNLRSLTRKWDRRNLLRDILSREILKIPDLDRLRRFLDGKTLSIYGGASSVGRGLLGFLISHQIPVGRVVIINPPGNNLNLLKQQFPQTQLPFELRCVEKSLFAESIYEDENLYGSDQPIALQMAGVKYHHHAERNPWEAFHVNAYGTARVLDSVASLNTATTHRAGYYLFTSSDKATDMKPINMLGLTRKLGEFYLLSRAASSEANRLHIGITRFTHILNSTGSWLFHKLAIQESYNKPFTLTEKRAYTSFIRLDEAVIQVVDTLRVRTGQEGNQSQRFKNTPG